MMKKGEPFKARAYSKVINQLKIFEGDIKSIDDLMFDIIFGERKTQITHGLFELVGSIDGVCRQTFFILDKT